MTDDYLNSLEEPDLMAAVQGQQSLALDPESFAASLIDEDVPPDARAIDLIMAMREVGLVIQKETVEVDRAKKVKVPIWALVALFKAVLKRLR